jgi:hypothetical protein
LILGQAVIAAIVGTAGGAAAGLWSVRHERSKATPAVQTPARSVAGSSSISSGEHGPSSAGDDGQELMQRARALAQGADVKALVALRESIIERANERGETESAGSKQQLAEIDRYLAEARRLRLRLDAEQFRNAGADASRPR